MSEVKGGYGMKEFSPKNLWQCKYNGEVIIIKATQDEMEDMYQHDPLMMSDYVAVRAYKLERKKEDLV